MWFSNPAPGKERLGYWPGLCSPKWLPWQPGTCDDDDISCLKRGERAFFHISAFPLRHYIPCLHGKSERIIACPNIQRYSLIWAVPTKRNDDMHLPLFPPIPYKPAFDGSTVNERRITKWKKKVFYWSCDTEQIHSVDEQWALLAIGWGRWGIFVCLRFNSSQLWLGVSSLFGSRHFP
jgi:hypothetical protein